MSRWTPAPAPIDELERLGKLGRIGVREGQQHAFLDIVAELAARDLGAPMALVSMVDQSRQWFLARHGLDVTGTGRSESFCGHCVAARAPLVIDDARNDARFAHNPLVEGAPHLRAYLGVPLFGGPAQSGIGTLCILDSTPRTWSAEQRDHLARLALLVETYLDGLAYRRVWEDSPLCSVLLDDEGRCVRVNPAFVRMTGRPLSTLVDKSLVTFVLPADRSVLSAMHAHARSTRTSPTRRELRFVRLSGEIVSGGVNMSPVAELEGQVVVGIRDISLERRVTARSGVIEQVRRELEEPLRRARAIVQEARSGSNTDLEELSTLLESFPDLLDARIGDIAARSRAEAELAASEQRVRTLMEQVLGPLLVLDDRGRMVDANAGALDALGWKYDQLVGVSLRAVVPAFTNAMCARWFSAAEARADGKSEQRATFVRRDGSELQAELRLMQMDWNGPGRLVLIARDVTAAYVRETTLLQERDALASQVRHGREELDELHQMEAALKQSLEEKDTMLKEIHHRVKNNLQMVSSLLTLQMDQVGDPVTRDHLAEGVRRVRSMALIHQHLYGAASLERVDLGAYARALADALRLTLAPTARVRTDVQSLEVPVDRAVPICLLLNELLTNALKYGTPEPANRAADAEWDVRLVVEEVAGPPRALRLGVHDRGPGLPANFRLHGHASLGLQLVTTLARQVRATVSSRTDRGAVFEVLAPLL